MMETEYSLQNVVLNQTRMDNVHKVYFNITLIIQTGGWQKDITPGPGFSKKYVNMFSDIFTNKMLYSAT